MKVFPLSDFRIQEEFQWIVIDLRSLLDEKRSGDLLQCRQEARKSLEEILSDTLKGYPFTFWSSIKCWLRKLFLGETNPEEWSKKLKKTLLPS